MSISIKVAAVIISKNKLLLIKEWSKKRKGFFWNLVKGTYNPEKDKDLIAALYRESLEEVFVRIQAIGLLSIIFLKRADNIIVQFNFKCKVLRNRHPKLGLHHERDEKIVEFRWFSKEEFNKLKRNELFNIRTKKIADDFFAGKQITPLNLIKNVREVL